MNAASLRLFVYGTLKRGGRHHERFCGGAISIEPARTVGTIEHLAAGYPVLFVPQSSLLADGSACARDDLRIQANSDTGAIGGDPLVAGELLTFDDAERRLLEIDAFEDFHPGQASSYWRVLIPVRLDVTRRKVAAWAYVGNPR